MLTLENVTASYGRLRVLHDVKMAVRSGEVVALLGANGAGKTTMLRAISGLIRPTAGRVLFDGDDVTGLPPHAIVRRGVVHVPEGRELFSRLTVRENLEVGADARGREHRSESLALVHEFFPVLADRAGQHAGSLSGGEQQMLAIGRALMSRPRLLMLDEPSLGLAPLLVSALFKAVTQIRETGITILLVEQNAKQALQLSDRAYVLENGLVVLDGQAKDLAHDPRVQRAYLGTDA